MKVAFNRPFAVSTDEYPFQDRWLKFRDGVIHYLDEGQGPTVLLLHGNPTWSYLYRNIIKPLRGEARLIAIDYPGFGMSKAPAEYGFTPQEHLAAVESLIAELGIKDFILVVQDWGGPIGTAYAADHRQNLRGMVLMNTWAWPASLPKVKLFSMIMGGWPLGYWLQTRKNFFASKIVPAGIHRKENVTDSLRNAYTDPFPTPRSRVPTWVFPRQIRHAKKWLAETERKLTVLSDVPAQILWGAQDKDGFPLDLLKKWQGYFNFHETEILEDASHYVQEDRPDRVVAAIRRVIERTTGGEEGSR